MPEAAIGADILIGFPGENEKAFAQTHELIETLPISYLHVFPFSERPGTPAARLSDKVPPEITKERCEFMRKLGYAKRMKFYRKFVGRTLPMLIETKRDGDSGLLKAISSNYLPVSIRGGDDLKNRIVDVTVEKLEGNKLFGNFCH